MTDRAGGVAGLVLAAGAGRRLGRAKAELVVGGQTLAARAVSALLSGGVTPPVLLVVAPGTRLDVDGRQVANPGWHEGMGASLRLGLDGVAGADDADAVVVTLVDTPAVSGAHVARLVDAWRGGARVAVATYGGARRTPVLLGREHWPGVARLAVGDVGARAYLDAHPDLVVPVPCDDLGAWRDLDTPADLAALGLSAPGPAAG